jgi:hypothetical protein
VPKPPCFWVFSGILLDFNGLTAIFQSLEVAGRCREIIFQDAGEAALIGNLMGNRSLPRSNDINHAGGTARLH